MFTMGSTDEQGSFIIRQLCIFLKPEDIYKEHSLLARDAIAGCV
jgi:hypothetical protein